MEYRQPIPLPLTFFPSLHIFPIHRNKRVNPCIEGKGMFTAFRKHTPPDRDRASSPGIGIAYSRKRRAIVIIYLTRILPPVKPVTCFPSHGAGGSDWILPSLSLSLAIRTLVYYHARFVTLIRKRCPCKRWKSLSAKRRQEGGSIDPDRYRLRFFAPLFLLCDFLPTSCRVASVFINDFDRLSVYRESIGVRLDSK